MKALFVFKVREKVFFWFLTARGWWTQKSSEIPTGLSQKIFLSPFIESQSKFTTGLFALLGSGSWNPILNPKEQYHKHGKVERGVQKLRGGKWSNEKVTTRVIKKWNDRLCVPNTEIQMVFESNSFSLDQDKTKSCVKFMNKCKEDKNCSFHETLFAFCHALVDWRFAHELLLIFETYSLNAYCEMALLGASNKA